MIDLFHCLFHVVKTGENKLPCKVLALSREFSQTSRSDGTFQKGGLVLALEHSSGFSTSTCSIMITLTCHYDPQASDEKQASIESSDRERKQSQNGGSDSGRSVDMKWHKINLADDCCGQLQMVYILPALAPCRTTR